MPKQKNVDYTADVIEKPNFAAAATWKVEPKLKPDTGLLSWLKGKKVYFHLESVQAEGKTYIMRKTRRGIPTAK